ncbi:MAG: hypothetical protein JWP41_3533 [Ramlibacter sp.]|nr:hypothetical protein [Ramlibacter sp.]
MNPLLYRARLAAVIALAAAAGLAHALTLPQLQSLLQATAIPDAQYVETRESPWLSAPVTTRGTLHVTPLALEKRVESPRQETWRMSGDRLEWKGPGGAGARQILFTQAPALQALADVTRRAVSGDVVALERDFRIVVTGDENVWSAQLQPRTALLSRQLDTVELQGTGGRLRVLIVTERQGERTTTRILP